MTPKSTLEIEGNFLTHPFAELLVEIAQARLDGSLRVSDKERKCIIYFKSGKVVFAVSNARAARIFQIMLSRGKLDKKDLAQIPNFQNDFEFTGYLVDKGILTRPERISLFIDQIQSILVDVLTWTGGSWTFSSLTRIRDGLEFEVDISPLLLDYARTMPVDKVLGRFRSLREGFERSDVNETELSLRPDEAFVLSRANDGELTAADISKVAGTSEAAALHMVYTLWLGGLLIRHDWQPALSDEAIAIMRTAKLELKKEAESPTQKAENEAPQAEAEPVAAKASTSSLSVDEYLKRVETAETYYDLLGVANAANADEIKQAYFSLARAFHPDLYHAEGGETFRRVQNAFTELAQAHETLRSTDRRELYDYRMRKELASRAKREASGDTENATRHAEEAAENFEHGFSLLMDDQPDEAVPFLARAAHYAPQEARYRAYFGKALSYDDAERHRAESEMRAAVKIDPNNPTFRLLLAEFFMQFKLMKRAEGELTRLLAIAPNNREARDLLASIQK
jgi:curved DNA-binding protein CbpA